MNAVQDREERLRVAINGHADNLTDALGRAEAVFTRSNLGVEARVPLDAGHTLVFGKIDGGEWGLIVEDANGTRKRLSEAKRTLRCAAASELDELYTCFLELAEQQLEDIRIAEAATVMFINKACR
jgi:hypothetical protein